MADTRPTNVLARIEESTRITISDMALLADKVREWQQQAHVLSPIVQVSALAPSHVVSIAVVVIDSTIDDKGMGTDCYGLARDGRGVPWLKERNQRCLGKIGLQKIAQAAGINWVAEHCHRTDDLKTPNYWSYVSVAQVRDFDGTMRTLPPGEFELDLRDGSPALKGFGSAQIEQARKSGLRVCQSKSQNAAIRPLGIKQIYTLDELAKPFVILRSTFVPDMSDPETRRMVTARAIGGAQALYPAARRAEADVIDVQPEPAHHAPEQTATPATTQAAPSNGTQAKPPVQEAKREVRPPAGPIVVRVKEQSGNARDTGRPYTRWFVALDNGVEAVTFDAGIAQLATKLRDEKFPCVMQTQSGKKEGQLDIVELLRWEPGLFDGDDVTDADLPAAGDKY